MSFVCAHHRAFVYAQGGVTRIAELAPLSAVRWQRIRDDVSTAQATLPTDQCCDVLADLRTIKHELHIERDGHKVWQGPITRIEYEIDETKVFAEDVLWPTRRAVIEIGYDQTYPNLWWVIDRMEWLLYHAYFRGGDRWRMTTGRIRPVRGPDDPRTSRVVNAWQMYVWEDFDKYAQDYGADYTVINRDIFFWDTQMQWMILPPLDETHLSDYPRIVEYGNQAGTRGVVTNGQGYAGISEINEAGAAEFGLIDWLTTNEQDGSSDEGEDPDATPPTTGDPSDEDAPLEPEVVPPPTPEELAQWTDTARRSIAERSPPPVAVVIPANTTLMPGAPWSIDHLVPGAWFRINVSRLCRTVSEWQRLQEITVTEEAPRGEQVNFSAVSAPAHIVGPPGGPIIIIPGEPIPHPPPPPPQPQPCVGFFDSFDRVYIGTNWAVYATDDNPSGAPAVPWTIDDGAAITPDNEGALLGGTMHTVASFPPTRDMATEIMVSNVFQGDVDNPITSYFEVYTRASDDNGVAVVAWFQFRGTYPNGELRVGSYTTTASGGVAVDSGFVENLTGLEWLSTDIYHLRLHSAPDGHQTISVNAETIIEWDAPPMTNGHMGAHCSWSGGGGPSPFTSPRILAVSGGCTAPLPPPLCVPVLTEPFTNFTAAPWDPGLFFSIVSGGRSGTCAEASGTAICSYTIPDAKRSDTVTIGVAFRLPTLASTRELLHLAPDSGATHLYVGANSNGSLSVTFTTFATGTSAPGLVTVDTWHYLEVQARLHSTDGFVAVRLDDEVVIDLTDRDTITGPESVFTAVWLMGNAGGNHRYDDLYLSAGPCAFQGDPNPCVPWVDHFSRPDGLVGTNWLFYDPQLVGDYVPFAIDSGAAILDIPTPPPDTRTSGGMRWHEAQAAGQAIEVEVDNVFGNNGYIALYAHVNDADHAARIVEFNFYEDEVGGLTGTLTVESYHSSAGGSWTSQGSVDMPFPSGQPVRLRFESDTTQRAYVNGTQVLTWTDPTPVTGPYVAIGTVVWTHLGTPYTSPRILSITGGCP